MCQVVDLRVQLDHPVVVQSQADRRPERPAPVRVPTTPITSPCSTKTARDAAGRAPIAESVPISLILSLTIRISVETMFSAATTTIRPMARNRTSFSVFSALIRSWFCSIRSMTSQSEPSSVAQRPFHPSPAVADRRVRTSTQDVCPSGRSSRRAASMLDVGALRVLLEVVRAVGAHDLEDTGARHRPPRATA